MSNPHYVAHYPNSPSRENLYTPQDDYYRSSPNMGSSKEYGTDYPPAKSGYNPAQRAQPRSSKRKWWIIGAILLLLIIVGAVVGGIVGSNAAKNSNSANKNSNLAFNGGTTVSRDTNGNPVYPSSASTAAGAAPTVVASNANVACTGDNFTPGANANGSPYPLRPGHPRLFAPSYRWGCLGRQIANDPYMASWNDTIMANATRYLNAPIIPYVYDGGPSGSGVLDPARETQLMIKHLAYAWRMTNDTRYATRAWAELLAKSGNDTANPSGTAGDNWNSQHFLDVAEFTLAFAYAYDWMYDAWTAAQRNAIMWSIITLGLDKGITAYGQSAFWLTATGNWNCVCNGGLALGALAILDDDPTGMAATTLRNTVANAGQNCVNAVASDGTWQETSDYWYFGSQGHAQLASGLVTATGSDQGLFSNNANFNNTGLFHMYGTGFVEKFNWGDCGPNKYTATANPMLLYGDHFNIPSYTLFQRLALDAPDPLSMFWYNPQTSGDFWANMPLDHYFPDAPSAWASMRGSWTDSNQIYAGIKGGSPEAKQTHSNLDAGTFVLEALGQRWAGELCQGEYLNPGYFASEAQNAVRWLYYRCRTEGQNTLTYNAAATPLFGNQVVGGTPSNSFGTTGEAQTTLAYTVPTSSAAYFVTDLSTAYSGPRTIRRGLRLINGRRQMLLRDELSGNTAATLWRMHTNATITYSNNNQQANLALGGQTMQVTIRSPSGAQFATLPATRLASSPALPSGGVDLANDGVSVLSFTIPANAGTAEVLFNPQWSGFSAYANPPNVALAQWSTTSHN